MNFLPLQDKLPTTIILEGIPFKMNRMFGVIVWSFNINMFSPRNRQHRDIKKLEIRFVILNNSIFTKIFNE